MAVTTFYPNACTCVIELHFDIDAPIETRAFTPKVIKHCPLHQGDNDIEVFEAIQETNRQYTEQLGSNA